MPQIKTYPEIQSKGWATKYAPPNIKKMDPPPAKRSKGPHAPPEVHIAVNMIAPTPGAEGSMKGSYVVSQTPLPPIGMASTLGPSSPEDSKEVTGLGALAETGSVAPPPGRQIFVTKAALALVLALAKCAESRIMLTTEEVLTLMDHEDPQPDGTYLESLDELITFGVHDAIDIYALQTCHLKTLGKLCKGGAHRLRHFTLTKILIPLGLHNVEDIPSEPSVQEIEPPGASRKIYNWQKEVAIEIKDEDDIEEVEDRFEEVEDEIEEIGGESEEVDGESEEVDGNGYVSEEI